MRRIRGAWLEGRSVFWGLTIVALVLAFGGTGYAAHRYVITSTKQISPKVVKQLRGKTGSPGAPGLQGSPGAQGPAGTARASAQVMTGINPAFDANRGFPGQPRRVAMGKYCVQAPQGVTADTTAVLVGLSGGSAGFVTQAGPPAQLCRADEFEIWTANANNEFSDGVFFNILLP
jgi:hypothetical protein